MLLAIGAIAILAVAGAVVMVARRILRNLIGS